ncbi:hypothetical protein B0T20DRAFT_494865 [Sordaria brevicollis]|uniref:Uncharacterized protein n=1 Tax=Sordaria brevicollis TaxID=83679 RepID=A0AAE0PJS3_SORBR|nr:hypothetical protein B0T20DRAFT_494865 [Sordaria brevicollis]
MNLIKMTEQQKASASGLSAPEAVKDSHDVTSILPHHQHEPAEYSESTTESTSAATSDSGSKTHSASKYTVMPTPEATAESTYKRKNEDESPQDSRKKNKPEPLGEEEEEEEEEEYNGPGICMYCREQFDTGDDCDPCFYHPGDITPVDPKHLEPEERRALEHGEESEYYLPEIRKVHRRPERPYNRRMPKSYEEETWADCAWLEDEDWL